MADGRPRLVIQHGLAEHCRACPCYHVYTAGARFSLQHQQHLFPLFYEKRRVSSCCGRRLCVKAVTRICNAFEYL